MDLPPYQWRADGGYRPPEGYQEQPSPYMTGARYCCARHPKKAVNHVLGALGIYGLCSPPTQPPFPSLPYNYSWEPSADSTPFEPQLPAPPKAPKKKKTEKKKVETKTDVSWGVTNAVPPLRAGTIYMFPLEHTMIHVLRRAASVWKDKYRGERFPFMIYKVSTLMSVRSVIQNVMTAKVGTDFDKCNGWAATEVIEQGDGKWAKGTTVEYASEKADGTLLSMGWCEKRGESLPPVWLTIHKV